MICFSSCLAALLSALSSEVPPSTQGWAGNPAASPRTWVIHLPLEAPGPLSAPPPIPPSRESNPETSTRSLSLSPGHPSHGRAPSSWHPLLISSLCDPVPMCLPDTSFPSLIQVTISGGWTSLFHSSFAKLVVLPHLLSHPNFSVPPSSCHRRVVGRVPCQGQCQPGALPTIPPTFFQFPPPTHQLSQSATLAVLGYTLQQP